MKFNSVGLFSILLAASVSATAGSKDSYETHGATSYVTHTSQGTVDNGRGAYAGIGLGHTDLDNIDQDINVRAYMGYDLNRYFAVEAGLGKVTLEDQVHDVGDLTGIDVSVLAKLPITARLSAYSRLGYWHWDLDTSGQKGGGSVDGSDLLYGVGLDYQVSPRFKVRLDATRREIEHDNLDTLNAGIAYTW